MNEKEAIEYWKKMMDMCMENANICDENDFDEEATHLRKEQIMIETVINLLEKKNKDIHRMQELLDLSDANNVKKDKVINLMAEQLTTPIHSKEWVIDYYEREIEEDK